MKKVLALICLTPAIAFANWNDDLYGGFRIGGRNMGFKNNYGSTLFAKDMLQYSVFGGMNFNRCFGAELSLFTTQQQKRQVTVNQGATELGVANFSGLGSDTYSTKTRLSGGTLQATARYPLIKCVNVFGSAGVGYGQLKVQGNLLLDDGAAPTPAAQANQRINQAANKFFPVVGAGLDWRINRCFGARADIGWEGTSTFKKTFQTPAGAPNNYQFKAKNSFVYGLSVYMGM